MSLPNKTSVKREGWFARRADGMFYRPVTVTAPDGTQEAGHDWTPDCEQAFFFPTPPAGMAVKLLARFAGQEVRLVPVSIQTSYTFE